MLLLCDALGNFEMPIPGIARRAAVTVDEAMDALRVLESPDPHSRSKEEEGRRIIRAGEECLWHIVNYEKYRSKKDADAIRRQVAERVAKSRSSRKVQDVASTVTPSNASLRSVTPSNAPLRLVTPGNASAPQAEAEAKEAKTEATEGKEKAGTSSDSMTARQIIEDLNAVTGKHFRYNTGATLRLIQARLKEGYTIDDFRRVHRSKWRAWANDPKMAPYLRPETLYAASHFDSYLQESPRLQVGQRLETGMEPKPEPKAAPPPPKPLIPKEGIHAFIRWKTAVKAEVPPTSYSVWIAPLLPGSWDGTTLTLIAPHQMVLDSLLGMKAQSDRAAEAVGIKVEFALQKEDVP